MMYGIDKEYAQVCRGYIEQWITEEGMQKEQFTDDVIDYIIQSCNGIRELETNFKRTIETAKEYKIDIINCEFVDTVLS